MTKSILIIIFLGLISCQNSPSGSFESDKIETRVSNVKSDSTKTNLKEFEWYIQPEYYILNPFYEGLVAFKDNKGYGFINEKEEVVITPQYQMTFGFTDGVACVKKTESTDTLTKQEF